MKATFILERKWKTWKTYKLNVFVKSGVDSGQKMHPSLRCKSSFPEGRGLVIGRWTCYSCLAKIDDRVRRRAGRPVRP